MVIGGKLKQKTRKRKTDDHTRKEVIEDNW